MGKRKETSHPQINGETEIRKSSRVHSRRVNYQELSSDSDSDDSRDVSLIARGARGPGEGGNAATCTSNAAETARSGRGHGRDRGGRRRGSGDNSQSGCGAERDGEVLGWQNQGRRRPRSSISQRREGSRPSSNEGHQPLNMIRGSSLNVGHQPPNMIRGSLPPEQTRLSCKKTILSWLINHKLVAEGDQVCYYIDRMPRRAGRISGGGIICSCCQKEISVWDFEEHAGSRLRQPYKNIRLMEELQKGTCLQHYQIAAWQKSMESKRGTMFSYVPKENAAHQKYDTCSICGDGGDLICCEKCPSTYHPSCINMENVPHTNWFCPYCTCKFCGLGGEYKKFITCCQCDKKFHWRCFTESEKDFSRETLDPSYCGPYCKKIYEKLEASLGGAVHNSASYSWRVVCPMDMISTALTSEDSYIENNSKVAVAGMLLSEVFHSITDRCTGIDMVQSVVYSCGSNLNRLNFSRFYTFILEKNDEMIAAASVRIHGKEIAEMPFIATVEAYRRQGNCQMLMKAIESFLRDLGVENLIIPSTAETVEMWKRKCSFNVVNNELKRRISMYNTLMFPGAVRLCKDLKGITGSGRGDENDTGNTQSVATENPSLETDIRNGQELSGTVQVEGSTLDNDIGNGQEQSESGQEERPTQTYTQQNSEEREAVQAAQTDRNVRLYLDLNVGFHEQNIQEDV